jgi:hypothetical protein
MPGGTDKRFSATSKQMQAPSRHHPADSTVSIRWRFMGQYANLLDWYDEVDLGVLGRIEFAQSLWLRPAASIPRSQGIVDIVI